MNNKNNNIETYYRIPNKVCSCRQRSSYFVTYSTRRLPIFVRAWNQFIREKYEWMFDDKCKLLFVQFFSVANVFSLPENKHYIFCTRHDLNADTHSTVLLISNKLFIYLLFLPIVIQRCACTLYNIKCSCLVPAISKSWFQTSLGATEFISYYFLLNWNVLDYNNHCRPCRTWSSKRLKLFALTPLADRL